MTTQTDDIEVERYDGVQTITFARPQKKNAITTAMYETIIAAMREGESADDVGAHVFTGSGGVFTAGNDIQDFLAVSSGGDFGRAAMGFLDSLVTAEKPLVAAVDGTAVGIGTTMLFHMDLVYASPEATFRTPFLDLALVPEGGSSLLMPARMGHARAFEMLCLGTLYDGTRAKEAGFVNEVVADVEQHAQKAARQLSLKPPEALRLGRRLMRGDTDVLIKRMHDEAKVFMERLNSKEAREAFMAFMEKRPPNFQKSA